VRRALALGALVLGTAIAQPALAAPSLTLEADRGIARYGATVAFSGTLTEAPPGTEVGIYRREGATATQLATGPTAADGTYHITATLRTTGTYVAVAMVDATQVQSADLALPMQPTLTTRILGRRAIGERLVVTGKLLPREAGSLRFRVRGVTRRVALSALGGFRVAIPTDRPGLVRFALLLSPAAGYENVGRSLLVRLSAPDLRLGSAGPAVRVLERGLARQHYGLRSVGRYFGWDTYEAVLAFQKVHGLRRTGRVGSAFWSRFATAAVPRARVRRGDHIEVVKTTQVLYEVRGGKVARVIHVSTGATGNTPVGRWHVYRLGPGGSLSGMYYSMYFLRGFAIHGYHSVPPWPASHGCVRIPLWQAPGLYSRWGRIGTTVYVFG
jgi:N-acetylmuramoyl-L-alanine amidase